MNPIYDLIVYGKINIPSVIRNSDKYVFVSLEVNSLLQTSFEEYC